MKRYRLFWSSVRGTKVGKGLNRLWSGTQCEANSYEDAMKTFNEVEDLMSLITDNADEGVVFGMLGILDTETAQLARHQVIVGRRKTT